MATKPLSREESRRLVEEIEARAGQIIHTVRKKHNLTQVELAPQLGISQALLSKIENGILPPGLGTWIRFCQVTHTSPLQILKG